MAPTPAGSTAARRRLPSIWLSLAAAESGISAAFGLARWIGHFLSNPYEEDFRLNYVAAKIGLTYGWSHIYDLDLQRKLTASLGHAAVIDTYHNFVTPPLLAWIVVPFTPLSVPAGYLVWTLCSLAALVAAWWLVCPGRGLARLTLLLIAIAIWPMHYTFWLGQTATVSILCLAAAWWWLERERWAPAGVAMALALFIKPQLVLLLPAALLVSGRWKPALYWAMASAGLASVSLVSMGPHGVTAYMANVRYSETNLIHSVMTFAWFGGRGPIATGLEVTAGVAAIALAWYRRDRMDLVFALGIVGSTASAFYLHEYDPAVWVLAAWVVLRSRTSLLHQAWLVIGIAAAQFVAIGVFKQLVIWEAGWIVVLGIEPWLFAHDFRRRDPLAV